MRTTVLLLAGFAALAAPASARSKTDYPHRDWGKVAILDMTAGQATACIARELGRSSDTTILPVEGGSDIDVTARVAWGKKHEPWQTFKVRQEEGGRATLRALYRKPLRLSRIDKDIQRLQRSCLKVNRVEAELTN